jgi:hypothetical protein
VFLDQEDLFRSTSTSTAFHIKLHKLVCVIQQHSTAFNSRAKSARMRAYIIITTIETLESAPVLSIKQTSTPESEELPETGNENIK